MARSQAMRGSYMEPRMFQGRASTICCLQNLNSGPVAEGDHKDTPEDQQKKANLGKMVDQLKHSVPKMLSVSLPRSLLAPDIALRICPTHLGDLHPVFLNIKGHVSYYGVCKALRFALTSFVLHPGAEIHLESIKVNSEELAHGLYRHTTKICIRFSTCQEGCDHLAQSQAAQTPPTSKSGSHSWSIDPGRLSQLGSSPLVASIISQLAAAFTKDGAQHERVISGLFIFELNHDNTQILVHTIENVNIVERTDTQMQVA